MATKRRPPFDPKSFLAKIGEGRTISKYRKNEIVLSQGDPADAVFYVQKGKVKVTVVSDRGKEAVVAILGADEFCGEGADSHGAYRRHGDDGMHGHVARKNEHHPRAP
jgi:CRP/FNR family transcriptional regulator, cyclic AMP receptor protein